MLDKGSCLRRLLRGSLCTVIMAVAMCRAGASDNPSANELLGRAVRTHDLALAKRALHSGADPNMPYVWDGLINIDEPHKYRGTVLLAALDWLRPMSGCFLGMELVSAIRLKCI